MKRIHLEKIMEYTELEKKVIETFGSYLNYESLEDNLNDNATFFTFTEAEILTEIKPEQLKGVISSLVKKGICYIDDSTIYSINYESLFLVTNAGVETYYRLKEEENV